MWKKIFFLSLHRDKWKSLIVFLDSTSQAAYLHEIVFFYEMSVFICLHNQGTVLFQLNPQLCDYVEINIQQWTSVYFSLYHLSLFGYYNKMWQPSKITIVILKSLVDWWLHHFFRYKYDNNCVQSIKMGTFLHPKNNFVNGVRYILINTEKEWQRIFIYNVSYINQFHFISRIKKGLTYFFIRLLYLWKENLFYKCQYNVVYLLPIHRAYQYHSLTRL